MAKPIKTLELHYQMIQFLINTVIKGVLLLNYIKENEKRLKGQKLRKLSTVDM